MGEEDAPSASVLPEAERERAFAAERAANVVRLAVVVFLVVVYAFLMDKAGTSPTLAFAVLGAAVLYGAIVLVFEPYRGYPVVATGAATSVVDGTLIVLWLVATGGWASPFYPLWYVSIAAFAYRFGPRETAVAATAYGAAYAVIAFATGPKPLAPLVIRIGFIGLVGLLGALISTDVLEQITARRQTEDLARQLEVSTRELERRNAELEQFAHAVSHDLRSPLTVVMGNVDLLETRVREDLDDDDLKRLADAKDAAERIDAMLDALLDYVRIDTRANPPQDVDLAEVVADVRTDLASQIQETGGDVVTGDLPTVHVDRAQVYQLLLNLVGNALKFHGDDPPTVEVRAERDGGVWRFEVEDDGVGIGPAEHDRIFEIFERSSTAGDAEGTGLGLSLCRKIVDRVGGDIGVESEAGEGATFWFTLPADDEDASEDAQASGMHAPVPP